MKKYSAIIFDLDGVIIETDKLHYAAWLHVAQKYTIPFDEETNNLLRGRSRIDSLDIILSEANITLDNATKNKMLVEKNDLYVESLATLSWASLDKDVLFTLNTLKEYGIPMAIASSSKNAKTILKNAGIIDLFSVIIDGTLISKAKPDPEIFLLAAQHLNVSPHVALVVEDALAGIKAASSANFDSALINNQSTSSGATYKLNKLSDLLKLI